MTPANEAALREGLVAMSVGFREIAAKIDALVVSLTPIPEGPCQHTDRTVLAETMTQVMYGCMVCGYEWQERST